MLECREKYSVTVLFPVLYACVTSRRTSECRIQANE
jgi:hypothetical protein